MCLLTYYDDVSKLTGIRERNATKLEYYGTTLQGFQLYFTHIFHAFYWNFEKKASAKNPFTVIVRMK